MCGAAADHSRGGWGHLNTTVRAAGLPSARAVASCIYLAYGRLLFCVSDRCNNDLQGAWLTACCVVIVCERELRQQVVMMRHHNRREDSWRSLVQGVNATAAAAAPVPGTMRLALTNDPGTN